MFNMDIDRKDKDGYSIFISLVMVFAIIFTFAVKSIINKEITASLMLGSYSILLFMLILRIHKKVII
jgi:hypothetical protein